MCACFYLCVCAQHRYKYMCMYASASAFDFGTLQLVLKTNVQRLFLIRVLMVLTFRFRRRLRSGASQPPYGVPGRHEPRQTVPRHREGMDRGYGGITLPAPLSLLVELVPADLDTVRSSSAARRLTISPLPHIQPNPPPLSSRAQSSLSLRLRCSPGRHTFVSFRKAVSSLFHARTTTLTKPVTTGTLLIRQLAGWFDLVAITLDHSTLMLVED